MDRKKEIQRLFDKYLRKACTPEELELLLQWLQEDALAGELMPQMKKIWEQLKDEEQEYPVQWKQLYQKITRQDKKQHTVRYNIRRIAAAAAVLFLIAGGAVLWYLQQISSPIPKNTTVAISNNQEPKDIAPGGNKATLTLGNGQKIILNNAATGTLTRQHGISIVKIDSSLLAYHSEKNRQTRPQFNTLTTPRGGQFQLVLPDGTKVWLNAASSIRFPTAFNGAKRIVKISGEAYFEVTHDPDKPFIVNTAKAEITVLGTDFNIQAYPDENAIKTTLVDGKVRIAAQSDKQHGLQMTPGQQVVIDKNGRMQVINHADIEEVIGWKNGLFVFHNENIRDIMYRLARWYNVEIEYDQPVPKRHFTGAVRRQVNLSEVLKMLELAGDTHFKIRNRKIIVSIK